MTDKPIPDCRKITVKKVARDSSLEKYRIEVLELKKAIKEMQKQIWYTNKQVTKLGSMVTKA